MFRLNKYVHIIKNENYIALFHFMNGKIVLFMEAEAIELINTVMETGELESDNAFAKQLIAQDFIVPSDVDEQKLIDYHYNQYVYNSERVEIIMILSELCNFRCEYCYEEYEPTIMSNDIEEGVIHFIQDLIKTYHCKKLTISWFGGEPTLFKDRIIAFMQTVKKKIPDDIILNGYMTTNGYLLDFENFLDYYNVGITGYQITLDGFSHTHDELRKLKSGEATWDTVYKNLKAIRKTLMFSCESITMSRLWRIFLNSSNMPKRSSIIALRYMHIPFQSWEMRIANVFAIMRFPRLPKR